MREALLDVPGVTWIAPDRPEEVPARLADGAPILVSYLWEDSFLTPTLRWVQSVSAGVEQFPIDRLASSGVTLTTARGIHGPQVAEHAFALLLSLTRRVGEAMRAVPARHWRPRMGYELAGRTLGVLGLGTIGEEIARRGAGWGMRVIGTKRDPASYTGVAELVLGPESTVEVCRRSQAVMVVLPAGAATDGLVGAEALEALGDGWLVNVGRGSVVDEPALIRALTSGSLRGAGLDVFAEEPLPPSSPLWDLPNVVVTPHMAGLSPHYGPRLAAIFARNLAAFGGEDGWVNLA